MDLNNSNTPEDEKDLAQTPDWFVKAVEKFFRFKFNLDVCCLTKTAKCEAYYSLVDFNIDALTIPWGTYNWCNPPYSNIPPWTEKAKTEATDGKTTGLLIPDKPEVGYVRQCREVADTIIHMPFRLNFFKARWNRIFN